MKIANIVSTNKIKVSEDFNVVKNMDEIILGLPTLIIGFNYVNKNYPEFDVTEMKIENDLYWTCNVSEGRDKHQEELSRFVYETYKNLFDKINYIFIDPIQYKKTSILKILRKLYSIECKITYVNNDMIYIYGDKYIFGVDLKLLDYIGLNINKIISKIKLISSVFLLDSEILIEYKNTIEEFGNQIRYIPYLYSIKNEQNNTTSIIHIS